MLTTERQAESIVRKFFPATIDRTSKKEIMERLGIKENSFYNYSAIVKNHGLAESVPSVDGRSSDLIITDKGKEVRGRRAPKVVRGPKPGSTKKVLTPQRLQEYVDEYNRKNPDWPFELAPKGYRKEAAANK